MFAGMLVLSQSKHYGVLFSKLVAQLSLQEESERSKPESGKTGFKTEATNAQLSTENESSVCISKGKDERHQENGKATFVKHLIHT